MAVGKRAFLAFERGLTSPAWPIHWTPAQATAVFELLDGLNGVIWHRYGRQIQQVLRRDRVTRTAKIPVNIDDGDVPF
jgi:hypothetical protein